MAQVTRSIQADIDRLLVFLQGEYEWAIESSSGWNDDEAASFVTEQPLRDEALDELRAYANHGRLSSKQRLAYEHLIHVMEQNEQLLAGLLDS